jgi:hypothetical protein
VSLFQASVSVAVDLNSTSSAGLALVGPELNQPLTVLQPDKAAASAATSKYVFT